MENKVKFIIMGVLVLLLAISFFANIQSNLARQGIERERDEFKKENNLMAQKIDESFRESRRLEDKMRALNLDLDKISKERDELQRRFELANKEKQELVERLREEQKKKPIIIKEERPVAPQVPTDSYWAQLLKTKTELESQVEKMRSELRAAQIGSEQAQRDKATLELDVNNLKREKEDLKRQLDYNQKNSQELVDKLASDFVREKNDKFQIQETIRSIQNENEVLRRQLKKLNARKNELEKKIIESENNLTDLQKANDNLKGRFNELDMYLKDKAHEVDTLKKQLGITQAYNPPSATAQAAPQAEGSAESVELSPIVVRPQAESATAQPQAPSLETKVLAINRDNNFVVIDLGEDSGIKTGDNFHVYRQGQVIADIEVIQTRKSVTACDIKKEITPIQVGDVVK